MSRTYAVQDRDLTIRQAPSRKAAKRDQAAYGGLLVSRKGTGVWKPYKPRHVFLWVFAVVQVIFIIWIITAAASGGGIHGDAVAYCHSHPDQYVSFSECVSLYGGGAKAGTAIGAGLVVVVWVVVDFLMAVCYGIYRLARR